MQYEDNGKNILPGYYEGIFYDTILSVSNKTGASRYKISDLIKRESVQNISDLFKALGIIKDFKDIKAPVLDKILLNEFDNVSFPAKYNGDIYISWLNISKRLDISRKVISEFRQETDSISDVIELCLAYKEGGRPPKCRKAKKAVKSNFKFPQEYNGTVFNTAKEIASEYNVPYERVLQLKSECSSTLELIKKTESLGKAANHKTNVLEQIFPRVIEDKLMSYQEFLDFYELESRQACHAFYHSRRKGISTEDFLLKLSGKDTQEDFVNPESFYLSYKVQRSSCFWLCGILFIPSVSVASERFNVPKALISKNMERYNNRELGFIKSFIDERIKKYHGKITPFLYIDELSWKDGDSFFYRCMLNESVTYLSEQEIMHIRLNFGDVNASNFDVGQGIFSSEKELCNFYNCSEDFRRIRYRDTTYELLTKSLVGKSSKFPITDEKSGFIPLKQLRSLKLNSKTRKKIVEGELSIAEAKRNKQKVKSRSFTFYEPIFDKKEVVGKKKIKFSSKREALSHYNAAVSKYNQGLNGEDFGNYLYDFLVRKQNKKQFIFGLEFDSKNKAFEALGIEKGYGIFCNKDDEDLEEALIKEYLKRDNTTELLNKKLKLKSVEILGWSFTEDVSGLNYFSCKFIEEGRIRIQSSKDLLLLKVQEYKNSIIK